MSGTYKATGFERSWTDVARRTTGNDTDADYIRKANPAFSVPLPVGAAIHVPAWDKYKTTHFGDDPLTIEVNGQRLGTVTDFELVTAIDACAKGGFTVPNTPETRDLFEPISFPIVTVDSFGERLFTGRASTPPLKSKEASVTIWADPAILETCPPPNESFPSEWRNATLQSISQELAALHGIKTYYEAPDRARFKRVDIEQSEPVLGFLQNLAAQRGLLLASNEWGELIIHDGTGGALVSYIEKGLHPCADMEVPINDDAYYSSVTVAMPSKSRKGAKGKSYDVPSPIIIPGIIRPRHFEAKDIDEGELEVAAQSVAGRLFAEIVTASADLSVWQNDMGQLYRPGQHVKIKSEEDRVYNPFEFLVAMVTFRKDAESMTANLNLVMPGVYSGEIPKVMPWQR